MITGKIILTGYDKQIALGTSEWQNKPVSIIKIYLLICGLDLGVMFSPLDLRRGNPGITGSDNPLFGEGGGVSDPPLSSGQLGRFIVMFTKSPSPSFISNAASPFAKSCKKF